MNYYKKDFDGRIFAIECIETYVNKSKCLETILYVLEEKFVYLFDYKNPIHDWEESTPQEVKDWANKKIEVLSTFK